MAEIIIWGVVLSTSTILFKKCSGTLNPCKLNILSFAYYVIVLQTIIGAVLTSFGFTEHYTYGRLNDAETFSQMGIFYSAVLILLLPIVSFIILRLFKINPVEDYKHYLQAETEVESEKLYFGLITIASIICILALIIMLTEIGYIPLWKLIFPDDNFDFAVERQVNEDIEIFGISYIKNIVIMYAIPVLSYISFGFALTSKRKKWIFIFIVLLLASIIVKTYNFAKAPIVVYLIVFVLIFIVYKGGISFKLLVGAGIAGLVLLIMGYKFLGYDSTFFDIYNGILGRTFFTQFGTLCMHFEAFTEYFQFLNGRSLYPTILSIIGMDPEQHVRSARVVMELYNPEGVYTGSAGVMNTVFIGEAYANWGILGIIVGIIWVGLVLTAFFIIFLKMKKNAITIAYCGILTQQLAMGLEGGFTDYIYSSTTLLNILGLVVLYYLPLIIEKIKKRKLKV